MSRECVIEFRQNGNRLDLEVQATAPDPAHAFGPIAVSRAPLQLKDADMDRMRSGSPPPGLVDQIANTVTQWLLMPEAAAPLDLPLLLRLNTDPNPPWRLVFSTEKITDETVLQGLSELPFELVQPPQFSLPLALQNGVSSIVHRLPKMGAPLADIGNWPLRILIVRSNPADLGGAVPPADAIRSVILDTKPELAANGRIRVDVLSSENAQGLAGRPTARNLLDQVSQPYDMLIYLGHGDLQPSPTGGPPLGLLLLETDDGQTPELEASGWELFVKPAKENRIKLHLQPRILSKLGSAAAWPPALSNKPVALASGPLLQVSLAIPQAPPVVCVAAMEGVRTQPPAPLCSLSNAVIVSAP